MNGCIESKGHRQYAAFKVISSLLLFVCFFVYFMLGLFESNKAAMYAAMYSSSFSFMVILLYFYESISGKFGDYCDIYHNILGHNNQIFYTGTYLRGTTWYITPVSNHFLLLVGPMSSVELNIYTMIYKL